MRKQIEIVSNHFTEVFQRKEETENTEPAEMKTSITVEEIKSSVKKLKKQKSIHADMTKYIHNIQQMTEKLLSEMAKTGKSLKRLQKVFWFHYQNQENHKDHLQISDQLFCYPYFRQF